MKIAFISAIFLFIIGMSINLRDLGYLYLWESGVLFTISGSIAMYRELKKEVIK
jgi:hypothetical protein